MSIQDNPDGSQMDLEELDKHYNGKPTKEIINPPQSSAIIIIIYQIKQF